MASAKRLAPVVALAVVLSAGLPACSRAPERLGGPLPVVVDTDVGSDDALALLYLLRRPDIDVRAITVAGDGLAHCGPGVAHVLSLLRVTRAPRVPVACGRATPLDGFRAFPREWRTATDAFYGVRLPPSGHRASPLRAVDLLTSTVRSSDRPLTILTLGPMTTLAQALRSDPGLARRVSRVVAMAGAVDAPGNEPLHQRAELNVWVDPGAADEVLRSGLDITLVPLDASNDVPMTLFFRDSLAANQTTPAAALVARLMRDPYLWQGSMYFWDPLAAVLLRRPDLATSHRRSVRVVRLSGPDVGRTEPGVGAAVRVTDSANAAAFSAEFLSTIAGRAVRIESPPAERTIAVSSEGSAVSFAGPRAVRSGRLAIRLGNSGRRPMAFVLGRLRGGHDYADVVRLSRDEVTSAPRWFEVVVQLPAMPGSAPLWGWDLAAGAYVMVCVDPATRAVWPLGELRVRSV